MKKQTAAFIPLPPAIFAAGAEPTGADFRPLDAAGRERFTLFFAPSDVGRAAHLRVCFMNYKGEKSPLSPVLAAPVI